MNTDNLIEQAAQRVATAQNISDEALVTFTVSEIEPVIHYMADQARMIEAHRLELSKIDHKIVAMIEETNALIKKGAKEHE